MTSIEVLNRCYCLDEVWRNNIFQEFLVVSYPQILDVGHALTKIKAVEAMLANCLNRLVEKLELNFSLHGGHWKTIVQMIPFEVYGLSLFGLVS